VQGSDSFVLIESLSQLAGRREQALIINVGTKNVSTLALLSALRYSGMPVLMIDCQGPVDDGSFEHFRALMDRFEFDLMRAPLRRHSAALDIIFKEIPAERVLLVDSDVEILNASYFPLMREFLDREQVFGSGFVEGPNWMRYQTGILRHGYFEERMWIPLTLLKTAKVREALTNGHSFAERLVYNDFAASRQLSRVLAKLRYKLPWLAERQLSWLDAFKESHHGVKPWLIWYDTGAHLFRHLKYEAEGQFIGLPAECYRAYARHFSGVTNNLLHPGHDLGQPLSEIEDYVRSKLRDEYDVEF
jgi:hypothetical protein